LDCEITLPDRKPMLELKGLLMKANKMSHSQGHSSFKVKDCRDFENDLENEVSSK